MRGFFGLGQSGLAIASLLTLVGAFVLVLWYVWSDRRPNHAKRMGAMALDEDEDTGKDTGEEGGGDVR